MCTATCAQLHKRAEKITATLMERGGLNTGDNVVLLYPPGKHTFTNTPLIVDSHLSSFFCLPYIKIVQLLIVSDFSVSDFCRY